MTARRPKAPAAVLSPGDLLSGPRRGKVRLGGRVVRAEGATLYVADALAVAAVTLGKPAADVLAGDLVLVEGAARGGALVRATLLERHPGRLGDEQTEFARLAVDGVGANLVARAVALRAVRDFFEGEDFVEVETPVRVPSPGLDAHVDAIRTEDGWLVTSPELAMKRLVVGGLSRVFQIARVTRKGEMGPLHEPEFTLVEWYRAFSGMDAMVRDTEALVVAVVRAVSGKARVVGPLGQRVELRAPFPRLTMREAFRRHAGIDDAADLAAVDEDRYFQIFVDDVEPALAMSPRPLVLCEFPATQAALSRPCPHDSSVAERFELYVAGVELCNGFGELTSPIEQRRRFVAEQERRLRRGAPVHPIDERFLSALEEGLPPSGGNALGLDRLLALALGLPHIDATMAFPSSRR